MQVVPEIIFHDVEKGLQASSVQIVAKPGVLSENPSER